MLPPPALAYLSAGEADALSKHQPQKQDLFDIHHIFFLVILNALSLKALFLIGLNLNFDTILTYKQSLLRERYAPFVLHLEFFLTCKIGLKRSKAEFMQTSCLVLL